VSGYKSISEPIKSSTVSVDSGGRSRWHDDQSLGSATLP